MNFASDWKRKGERDMDRAAPSGLALEVFQRVEKATSDVRNGPDWSVNMDICDAINSRQWQAKDVIKAIMKRLQHKNSGVQSLALTLLEALIKNCGDDTHFHVAESDILPELVKIVRKKSDMEVRDTILLLLDSWQQAFGGPQGKYPQYYQAYAELKKNGIKFPQWSGDAAPIFTPPITHPARRRHHPSRHGTSTRPSVALHDAMANEMGNLSLSDLVSIRRVMELLSDMLQAVNPNDSLGVKDEVIADLVRQCCANQNKIMNLVSSTGDEELLGLGLSLNDKLRNVIAKHDAIAYGFPAPTETFDCTRRLSESSTSGAVSTDQIEDEDEDENDGFSQLARRNSKINSDTCQSPTTTMDHDNSPKLITDRSIAEASLFTSSNTPALQEIPTPDSLVMKGQNANGHVTSKMPSNATPSFFPVAAPQLSNKVFSQVSFTSKPEACPNPQPYLLKQEYMPHNNYVVPWARQTLTQSVLQPQPQLPHDSLSYPPPPWEIDSDDDTPPSTTCQPRFSSRPLQQHYAFGFSGLNVNSSNVSKPFQQHHSFGSGAHNSFVRDPLQHRYAFGLQEHASMGDSCKTSPNMNLMLTESTATTHRSIKDSIESTSEDRRTRTSENNSEFSGLSGKDVVGTKE